MSENSMFADRIRARFPEGLTGLFPLGGTRTTYILDKNAEASDPGRIPAMEDYAEYGLDRMYSLMTSFYELGGQNIIFTPFSYQLFTNERGAEYAQVMAGLTGKLLEEEWLEFCRRMDIDQYFAGIDTLLHAREQTFTYELALKLDHFNRTWQYQEGRRKLIWEIAAIPLFSIWRARDVMGAEAQAELDQRLEASTDLQEIHDLLYRFYSRAVYGTELPIPHFYLGSNRNGDLKLRALLPVALLCGGPFRLYYTPYPSLAVRHETLKAILEDLAFGKALRSTKLDYSGQFTSEILEREAARVRELSEDPASTVGLFRQINVDSEG